MGSFFLILQTVQERNAKVVEFLKGNGVPSNIISAATNGFQLMAMKAKVKLLPQEQLSFEDVAWIQTANDLVTFGNTIAISQVKKTLLELGVSAENINNINNIYQLFAISLYVKFAPKQEIDFKRVESVTGESDLDDIMEEIQDNYIDAVLEQYGFIGEEISNLNNKYAKKGMLLYKTVAHEKVYDLNFLNNIDNNAKLEALDKALKANLSYDDVSKFITDNTFNEAAYNAYIFGIDEQGKSELLGKHPELSWDLKQLFSLARYNFNDDRGKELILSLSKREDIAYLIFYKNAMKLGFIEGELDKSDNVVSKDFFARYIESQKIDFDDVKVIDRVLHPLFPEFIADELSNSKEVTISELYDAFSHVVHPTIVELE